MDECGGLLVIFVFEEVISGVTVDWGAVADESREEELEVVRKREVL